MVWMLRSQTEAFRAEVLERLGWRDLKTKGTLTTMAAAGTGRPLGTPGCQSDPGSVSDGSAQQELTLLQGVWCASISLLIERRFGFWPAGDRNGSAVCY